MLPHVDKVKIPEINSSPSVFSLSLKEKEFGYEWLLIIHIQREQKKCQNPSRGEGEGKGGRSEFKDPEPPSLPRRLDHPHSPQRASGLTQVLQNPVRSKRCPIANVVTNQTSEMAASLLALMPVSISELLNTHRSSEPESQTWLVLGTPLSIRCPLLYSRFSLKILSSWVQPLLSLDAG